MPKLFFELLKISLDNASELSRVPSPDEWYYIYDESQCQAITSVMTVGLERLSVKQWPS